MIVKILFTCIGRRIELLQAYREAARKNNIDLKIIGVDSSLTAPALFFCDDKVQSPRISDPGYIPFLIKYCSDNNVDVLIPTIDTDLMLLSEHKNDFRNTRVIISSKESIKICRDKRLTGAFFKEIGLECPVPIDDYREYDLGFPAFIKPKDGSSSINAFKVNSREELEALIKIVPDYIIQPYVSGTEYTVDAFCDFEGNPIFITPRIRLAVRSGEVLKTRIVQDEKIISDMRKIIEAFKPCGPITVQLIRDDKTGEDYYIEINPRYGGGAPLSIKAGADSSEVLLKLMQGEKIGYISGAAEDGATYSRFDQSIRVDIVGE